VSASFSSCNGDEDFTTRRDGETLCIAFRKQENRGIWLACLYGEFERMLPPGDSGVVRAVVDDFGSLVRVQ
jgi:hypothetical protein